MYYQRHLYTINLYGDNARYSKLFEEGLMGRKQKGQIIETDTAWSLRYYTNVTKNGHQVRKQKCVKLTDKSNIYRHRSDLDLLVRQHLDNLNAGNQSFTGSSLLSDYVEKEYFPWLEANRTAATYRGYRQVWNCYLQSHLQKATLTNLKTSQVTAILDGLAKKGIGRATLGHIKWMLSAVYVYAISKGVIDHNPVNDAKWLVKAKKPRPKVEYSLPQVLQMLAVLEPMDIRAAVAIGICYFTSARPSECRGLRWEDWQGNVVNIRRSVWHGHVGDTKTESAADSVPVIEPLKSLLTRFHIQCGSPTSGYILANGSDKPLSLDLLNTRVIAPALKKADLQWAGYYACRRGISSLVTDKSKNPLNSTGLLRHSNSTTALQFYTKPQKDSVRAAMQQVEEMAVALQAKMEPETVQ